MPKPPPPDQQINVTVTLLLPDAVLTILTAVSTKLDAISAAIAALGNLDGPAIARMVAQANAAHATLQTSAEQLAALTAASRPHNP